MNENENAEQIRNVNNRAPKRPLSPADIKKFYTKLEEIMTDPKAKTLRVYSSVGFVPNSYKYPCPIAYIEAQRDPEGYWHIYTGVGDAKRPRGQGSLITINSRPA